MPTPWTHAILQWIGIAVSIIALVLGVLALYGVSVRSVVGRGRSRVRHCPGRFRWLPLPHCAACWYDLTGVPRRGGLTTCPECGRRSAEPALHRVRPPRPVLAAICLVPAQVLAYAIWTTPRVQLEGWTGFVPTSALVFLVPGMQTSTSAFAGPGPLSSAQQLHHALDRRTSADGLWHWQWVVALDRCGSALDAKCPPGPLAEIARVLGYRAAFRGHLTAERHRELYWSDLDAQVWMRPVWPAGATVYATGAVSTDGFRSGVNTRVFSSIEGHRVEVDPAWSARMVHDSNTTNTFPIGTAEEIGATTTVRVRVEHHAGFHPTGPLVLAREWDKPVAVRVVPRIEDAIECVEDEDVARVFLAGLRPLLIRQPMAVGGHTYMVHLAGDRFPVFPPGLTIGARLEVLRNGARVGVGEFWTSDSVGPMGYLGPTAIESEHPDIDSAEPATWRARIIGDPLIALRDRTATAAWVGEVTVDLDVQTLRDR